MWCDDDEEDGEGKKNEEKEQNLENKKERERNFERMNIYVQEESDREKENTTYWIMNNFSLFFSAWSIKINFNLPKSERSKMTLRSCLLLSVNPK